MEKYKSFDRADIARILTDLLDEQQINYELRNGQGESITMDESEPSSHLEVWLEKDQFDAIDDLIEDKANAELETVADDYFIFEFSNEELRNVLIEAEEWSHLDLALANKLLKDRGEPFDKDELEKLRAERIAKSAEAKDISKGKKILTIIVAILFPLIGIIIALVYNLASKEDLGGNRVSKYGEDTKKHGKILIGVALVGVALHALRFMLS